MELSEAPGSPERTPEAVLDFWFGPLRTADDASRENWKRAMLRWRLGPFARSAEDRNFIQAQREWCEQMHREGPERFFSHPAWDTPKGFLARLIVLDQFPRSVYRGTALAYANDALTASMTRQACEADRELADYNVIERFWIYLPLSHAEDLTLQERSIEKFSRWCEDLVADAPRTRRRINQFVGWSIMKAAIEHSEALLLFDRFPHRNAALMRPHRGGEPRYLTDPMRPLWSFTQPPNPEYFAFLGALHGTAGGLDEDSVTPEALACLLRTTGLSPEDPDSPMGAFDRSGGGAIPYPELYRHLLLPEQARTLGALRRMPPVVRLMAGVKRLFLRHGETLSEDELVWPPRSAKHSLEQAIDVAALNALVRSGGRTGGAAGGVPDGSRPPEDVDGREDPAARWPLPSPSLNLTVRNRNSELERVAAAFDEFADGHRFPEPVRFQVQLCLEEALMFIVEHGYDNAEAHWIEVSLDMNERDRSLAIRIVDDGRELDPGSYMFQPGPDTIQEENVLSGLGLYLVRTYVDELDYRRENGRNYLHLSKKVGP